MLEAQGIFRIDKPNGRIFLDVHYDFINYYNWFVTKEYWSKFHIPRHGSHITIGNTMFHDNMDWVKAKKIYDRRLIKFQYNPYIYIGGGSKGFTNFDIKVYSEEIDHI